MMKKLLSLALTLAMLGCMATTAFATDVKDHVVGTRGDHDGGSLEESLSDGVEVDDIGSGYESDYLIEIEVTAGDVQSRYAVDVEYTQLTLSLTGGTMVWDVNKLEYVVVDSATGFEEIDTQTITVTNYSDQGVTMTVKLIDSMPDDGMELTFTEDVDAESIEKDIEASQVHDLADPAIVKYDVNPEGSKTWTDVADYYSAYFQNNSGVTEVTAAKVQVIIAAT